MICGNARVIFNSFFRSLCPIIKCIKYNMWRLAPLLYQMIPATDLLKIFTVFVSGKLFDCRGKSILFFVKRIKKLWYASKKAIAGTKITSQISKKAIREVGVKNIFNRRRKRELFLVGLKQVVFWFAPLIESASIYEQTGTSNNGLVLALT